MAVLTIDPVRSLASFFYQSIFLQEASRLGKLNQEASKEIAGAFHGQAIAQATDRFLRNGARRPA